MQLDNVHCIFLAHTMSPVLGLYQKGGGPDIFAEYHCRGCRQGDTHPCHSYGQHREPNARVFLETIYLFLSVLILYMTINFDPCKRFFSLCIQTLIMFVQVLINRVQNAVVMGKQQLLGACFFVLVAHLFNDHWDTVLVYPGQYC